MHRQEILGIMYELHNCITCGIAYVLPVALADHQREKGGFHHCPNGHSQGWSKEGSELERTRRERDRLKQNEARLLDEKAEADRRAEAAEAEQARLRKRAAAATCPCCRRTFSDMARHMRHKHPAFVEAAGAKVVRLKARTA